VHQLVIKGFNISACFFALFITFGTFLQKIKNVLQNWVLFCTVLLEWMDP